MEKWFALRGSSSMLSSVQVRLNQVRLRSSMNKSVLNRFGFNWSFQYGAFSVEYKGINEIKHLSLSSIFLVVLQNDLEKDPLKWTCFSKDNENDEFNVLWMIWLAAMRMIQTSSSESIRFPAPHWSMTSSTTLIGRRRRQVRATNKQLFSKLIALLLTLLRCSWHEEHFWWWWFI